MTQVDHTCFPKVEDISIVFDNNFDLLSIAYDFSWYHLIIFNHEYKLCYLIIIFNFFISPTYTKTKSSYFCEGR
jgi:hypothetical protein